MESKPLIMIMQDVFQIEGRGTVITGVIAPDSELARRSTPIELHTPTNLVFSNAVAETERFLRGRLSEEPPKVFGILLATAVPSEQLPKGTKVYYAGNTQVA
jgi:hypothetical protein